jgi:predicted RNase H-like HicB family nuclease
VLSASQALLSPNGTRPNSKQSNLFPFVLIKQADPQTILELLAQVSLFLYSNVKEVHMRYSVLLEPIQEAGFAGWYYAHIPVLDLTTHGQGVEGALAAARELVEAWIAEKRANGDAIPAETTALIGHIEVSAICNLY